MEEKKFISICKALGDNNRMKIVKMLKKGSLCAKNDILKHLDCSQPTLSYHMKLLVESGIVRSRKQGLWTFYTVDRRVADNFAAQVADNFAAHIVNVCTPAEEPAKD